jgi:integrase
MSYFSAVGIAPTAVTAETFAQFGAELIANSLKRDPGGVYRDSCKAWNRAALTIPRWPQLQVTVPDRRRRFALPLEAFPPSFQADLHRFLCERANPDVFSDSYCKPVQPVTNEGRHQRVLMAATALVTSGFPMERITGLSVLVEPDNAKALLRMLLDRYGGKPTGYLHHIATLLKTIARHHAGSDEKMVAELRKLCSNLNSGKRGLTEKNKSCLRQFADPRKLAALLNLPRQLLAEVEHIGGDRRREAVRVMLALAIGIELVIPLRIRNLRGLCLNRHIHRSGERVFLSISADETKNGNPINAEFPPWLIRLLDRYVQHYRSRLLTTPSPWLFPGEDGEERSSGFGVQIGDFIAKEIGVTMTPHQFRHLAAKLYLDRRPGDYETVRELLGHKDIATTMRFYREVDTVLAVQRYGDLVTQLIQDLETTTAPRRQRRRHAEDGNARA